MATAADYEWTGRWAHGILQVGYCFTLIRIPPADLLDRLGAQERTTLHGAFSLSEPACVVFDRYQGSQQLVGVTAAGEWTFMAELNGFVGVNGVMGRVAHDTRSVAHYEGAHGVYRFLWIEDGTVCLDFEPLFASRREGTCADVVVDELVAAGFDLGEGPDCDYHRPREKSFALAERLTGVKVTPELLDDSTFECGLVAIDIP